MAFFWESHSADLQFELQNETSYAVRAAAGEREFDCQVCKNC